jgi:dephospho-CoA kinase
VGTSIREGKMKIIGLTGGIGAGKTKTAEILKKLGAIVIDADKVAKELLIKGNRVYYEIIDHFGRDILDSNSEIDKRKLAGIVFNDKSKLVVLNEITHNEVYNKMKERIDSLTAKEYKGIIVLDVPIPNEDFKKMADEIWVIDCDNDTRISRVMNRMGITREEAVKRMNAQLKREDYLRIADKVIRNTGTEEELKNNVISILGE